MTSATDARACALSIVVPVYNGAKTVGALVTALSGLSIPGGHEIILVDDGSADDSRQVCAHLAATASRVPVTFVQLSRNFGEHNAVMAGLGRARGDFIITMDDDLQNPPEEVPRLFAHARDGGYDVVYTHYATKQHSLFRNLGSTFANRTAGFLLNLPRGLYLSTFRCLSAFAVREICRYDGPFPHVDGLVLQVTRAIGRLQVAHLPRLEGRSNYTLRRLVRLWLIIALNFSSFPLRLGGVVGVAAAAAGALFAALLLWRQVVQGVPPEPGAGLLSALLLAAGIILLALGVVGEYVGRIFQIVSGRRQYAIRQVIGGPDTPPPAPVDRP